MSSMYTLGLILLSMLSAQRLAQCQYTLTVTGDARIEVYVNGVFRQLTHASDYSTVDEVVLFENNDRVIAIHGVGNGWCSGMIASTSNGDFMTGYTLRCTNQFNAGWQQPGFDDIPWYTSYIVADNSGTSPVCPKWQQIPEIHEEASWIWTANVTDSEDDVDLNVYCRGYLPVCDSSPCQNGGYCNPNGADSICECPPGYTGAFCETHLIQPCGDIMRLAPPDTPMRPGFDRYCYISSNDTEYLDFECNQLIRGIPDYPSYEDLINSGGNFGCWVSSRSDDPEVMYACVDDYQHRRQLGSCFNCTFMGVCIRFPKRI